MGIGQGKQALRSAFLSWDLRPLLMIPCIPARPPHPPLPTGKPRRLSLKFLKEERARLEHWREGCRQQYQSGAAALADPKVADHLPRPLAVGQVRCGVCRLLLSLVLWLLFAALATRGKAAG